MTKQSAINLDVTPESDGFKIAGGTTPREIKISGGNVELQGSGSAEISIPISSGNDTFMFKDFHKASSAEINTGTEDNKYITPDGLAGSNIGTKMIQLKIIDDATALTTGDGKIIFMIPEEMNGMNLVKAHAMVSTASSSGTPTIQIRNVTDSVDMLSTRITIDASEYTSYTAATAPVIDTSKDDVATGDRIAIDVDSAGSGAKGLTIFLAFRLP